MAETARTKKLIETGIPLSAINRASADEKKMRRGLPQIIHPYWARRPLATTRSILFAQLVDDPSSHPDRFPTGEAQNIERTRLHGLMERLAIWENTTDADLYKQARQAILDSNGGTMPAVLDPFAGGGAIPLEAQRLGCEAHASDLNPLAVIINKGLIEYPARFCNNPAVHPTDGVLAGHRSEGLSEDIQYYGKVLRDIAFAKVGHLYPTVSDEYGEQHTVIAWIWARTVTNPNPANPVQVPLVRSWWLSKKKGHEAWVKPIIDRETGTNRYEVQHNADGPTGEDEGTVNRKGAISIVDGTPIDFPYIREESRSGRLGAELIAIVADSRRGRIYVESDNNQIQTANCKKPNDYPNGDIFDWPGRINVFRYGMTHWADLFTNRQLTVLTTLCDSVAEVREQVLQDALQSGLPEGESLDDGGNGAVAYADAVTVYLTLSVSRMTDRFSTVVTWQSKAQAVRNTFARQAIPMTWDYAETNPFSDSSGNILGQVEWVADCVELVPAFPKSEASQADAAVRAYDHVVVSTDPPYYDNIGYSDLSDYFYVWLHRILHPIIPSVTKTALTPKSQELVANPYRHHGRDGAEKFFIDGFNNVFKHIRETARLDIPMTVYYAYKQKNNSTGTSTGWYALLNGLIGAGWEITATWPVRSELSNRMISNGTNALASSIVLACRPRATDAPAISMRAFTSILHEELTEELTTLMASGIDPVDLAQAAIGPGISVYSRYSKIREADGSEMPVQEALEIINHTLDEVLGDADTDYDADTRFAVTWYQSYGWNQENSGTADQLSRSVGTSPESLVYTGIFEAAGGKARLLKPQEMAGEWKPLRDDRTCLWEAVIRMAGILDGKGVDAVAPVMAQVSERLPLDQIKALGFRMYHEAEKRKDTQAAQVFNGLVSSWDDLYLKALKEMGDVSHRVENLQGELDVE